MSEQHAPWHVSHSQQGWDALVYDTNNRLVATINCARDDGDRLADFIAAAPDLLHALDALVNRARPEVNGDMILPTPAWEAALAALAKANGAR